MNYNIGRFIHIRMITKKYRFLFPLIILTGIVLLIYRTNLQGNFWLTGWDNLHPEFNYKANLIRAFFSSWQEYQGLGLPAGHGHGSELLRELFLGALSLIFQPILIRKIFVALMLFSGASGCYFFVSRCLFPEIKETYKRALGFFAGSFYLLHLITVQIFYTPYEAFIVQYGGLPWMAYGLYLFIKNDNKKSLAFLILVNLIFSSQFYVPTLFLVYIFFVSMLSIGFLKQRADKNKLKKILVIFFVLIITNLNWLFPFINYVRTNINSQLEAYNNILYSQDIYLKNANYGDLNSAVLAKGYLFSYVYENDLMMKVWDKHLQQPYVLFFAYFMAVVIGLGLLHCLFAAKKNRFWSFLFFSFFALIAVNVFPFSFLNELLRKINFFNQIFRNPFTKVAGGLHFVNSILFAYGLYWLAKSISSLIPNFYARAHLLKSLLMFFSVFLLSYQLIYLSPVWSGNLIYPRLRHEVPDEYFALFDFFKNQSAGRIANFPQNTPNGWLYYHWGYSGSGFLWYGITQPILDRAFDVWNKSNENYYWEISQTVYSQSLQQFRSVLEKYQIRWLVLDQNVTSYSSPKSLYLDQVKDLILRSPDLITIKNIFGKIAVYEVNLKTRPNNYVFIEQDPTAVYPNYQWSQYDQAHLENGNYITANLTKPHAENLVSYPFRSLFTLRRQSEIEFNLRENDNNFIFYTDIDPVFSRGRLGLPKISAPEFAETEKINLAKTILKPPKISINGQEIKWSDKQESTASPTSFALPTIAKTARLEVIIPKIRGYYSYQNSRFNQLASQPDRSCDPTLKNSYLKKEVLRLNWTIFLPV
ncbi:hypothetical protein HY214_04100 [Candidatus Roizmanbacteria bacterium]|nr:hypothetical protein [Candidatus Roizmanbacteria bacterium]